MTTRVVSFEKPAAASRYVADMQLPWPVLLDDDLELYRAFDMDQASFFEIWGPRTWLAYARELARGQKPVASDADIHQRGGDVLIDPDGIVRFHYIGKGPGDRPPPEAILEALDRCNPT